MVFASLPISLFLWSLVLHAGPIALSEIVSEFGRYLADIVDVVDELEVLDKIATLCSCFQGCEVELSKSLCAL
jgi:hypothetical protein